MASTISIFGPLICDPYKKNTANGSTMSFCTVVVALPCPCDGNNEVDQYISVVAFEKAADELLRHEKGDLVSVFGDLQWHHFKKKDGTEVQQFQVLAKNVMSAKTALPAKQTPKKASRKETMNNLTLLFAPGTDQSAAQPDLLNDEKSEIEPFPDEIIPF